MNILELLNNMELDTFKQRYVNIDRYKLYLQNKQKKVFYTGLSLIILAILWYLFITWFSGTILVQCNPFIGTMPKRYKEPWVNFLFNYENYIKANPKGIKVGFIEHPDDEENTVRATDFDSLIYNYMGVDHMSQSPALDEIMIKDPVCFINVYEARNAHEHRRLIISMINIIMVGVIIFITILLLYLVYKHEHLDNKKTMLKLYNSNKWKYIIFTNIEK